jgi:transcriptional regulator with XRE-family HTH domain
MSKFIHEILTEIRKENRYTRKALSGLSGFKEQTILNYERNTRKPSNEYIKFMSLYFDVSLDYINGVSDENKPLNELYRVFEMYKEIYPQNASKVDELIKEYDIKYYGDERCNMSGIDFINITMKLNISFLSFNTSLENEATSDYWYQFRKKYSLLRETDNVDSANGIADNGIVISKEFYLSVIKKRNEPNIYIPLENKMVDYAINLEIEKNLKDMNLKIINLNKEIEKNLKDMNIKIRNFNQEIDKTLKDIQKIQEDLTSKS